jgi:hypothetical protein
MHCREQQHIEPWPMVLSPRRSSGAGRAGLSMPPRVAPPTFWPAVSASSLLMEPCSAATSWPCDALHQGGQREGGFAHKTPLSAAAGAPHAPVLCRRVPAQGVGEGSVGCRTSLGTCGLAVQPKADAEPLITFILILMHPPCWKQADR